MDEVLFSEAVTHDNNLQITDDQVALSKLQRYNLQLEIITIQKISKIRRYYL